MSLKIKQDHARFKAIVRGKIKQNLRRFIQKGEMVGKKGKELITIPLPTIDIPHFRYGGRQQGGVGQGEGDPGTVLAPGQQEPGDGQGKAGQGEGEHTLEVDVSLEELAAGGPLVLETEPGATLPMRVTITMSGRWTLVTR